MVSLTSGEGQTAISLEVDFENAHVVRRSIVLTQAWLAASVGGIALATITPLLGLLALPAFPLASTLVQRWSEEKSQTDLCELERVFDVLVSCVEEHLERAGTEQPP